jgi:dTDP-4-amino-4,6-dideoxygalactose transaminase
MSYLPFAKPTIDEETIAGVAEVLRSGWITSGPKVQEFEQALSAYLGGRIVRTFTSATGALEVALQACGIGPGHEVIVPAMTFAASANVVMRVGAQPVFVDVELVTRNLDPAKLEAAVTPRTRAIMPVHFAGWRRHWIGSTPTGCAAQAAWWRMMRTPSAPPAASGSAASAI